MKKIGINGLGRIGRRLTHQSIEHKGINIVAINDIMPIDMAAYFLKYDSTYGTSDMEISIDGNYLVLDNHKILYSMEKNIEDLPWGDLSIDIAVNCSGTNTSSQMLSQYQNFGVNKTILSSPPQSDDIPIVILGYNDDEIIDRNDSIISNASCTTYCVAPLIDTFHSLFGIKFVNFTTIHCYTSDQNLQDAYHRDFRRSRAAAVNIIPTTTSATGVIKKLFPTIASNVLGSSFRVPTINGSTTEFVFQFEKDINKELIVNTIIDASKGVYKNIINYTNDAIVSSDILGNKYASVVDMNSIEVVDNYLKMNAFYDNESGYTQMLVYLIDRL